MANYNCIEYNCVHKNLFPINGYQLVEIITMAALSLIATTAGIGGGAIYSTLFMFLDNFAAIQAFPISNVMILSCSLCTFYVGVKEKMRNPEHMFVDWDLVMVFCPTLLLGTKIGVILNKMSPGILLNILLILILTFSSYKAYTK